MEGAYPYFPASVKVPSGSPRPIAVIRARSRTLQDPPFETKAAEIARVLTHASNIDLPHLSMTTGHNVLRGSALGTTFSALRAGKRVSYGGFSSRPMRQKNLHFGSG
jgi:hypothetical protein